MQSIGTDLLLDSEDRVALLKMRIEKFKKDNAELWTKVYPYKTTKLFPQKESIEETPSQSERKTLSMFELKQKMVSRKK